MRCCSFSTPRIVSAPRVNASAEREGNENEKDATPPENAVPRPANDSDGGAEEKVEADRSEGGDDGSIDDSDTTAFLYDPQTTAFLST